MNPQIQVVEKP